MQTVRVKYKDHQKYICYEGQLTFKSFLDCVAKKFDIPTLDLKVFDVTKTEVDEEVFEFLIQKQDLGVLEICLPQDPNDSLSSSASASVSSYSDVDSDDTIILHRSPASTTKEEDSLLAKMIEDILKNKPGGERIMNEYARTKSLTDARRRDMVKMLVAQMTSDHGTSPSRRVKEEYAKGITSLFPNLADPRSKFGFEHYYNAEDGSGYLAWRLKFVQKGASEGQKKTLRQSLTGGPKADRGPFTEANCLTTESLCCEAIALIEQDFNLMFGDVTSAKFLEKWPTVYKKKVLDQSRCLTQTGDLQDLVQNAGSTTEVENGWDSDMSSMMVLVHLLPPSTQGRKRPGKLSARQASEHLVKFLKTGTSIQGHLDSIMESRQPYLLAVGTQRSVIHKYFIVIDKHAIPCKSPDCLACIDELFKAHFAFGTSYNQDLMNVYNL
ncbi:hypothetical protein NQZ68_036357 [Dissostichus eleginoides]|nr:hypothetical protein NQZ68_036357 [Dissostichus eleginoides]